MLPDNIRLFPVSDLSFVGIKYHEDFIAIYYPETLDVNRESDSIQKDLYYFLNTLSLTKSDESNDPAQTINKNRIRSPFYSYRWLISDYLTNGLISTKIKKYGKKQNGKINWKRTIANRPLFYTNPPMYEPIKEYFTSVENDLVEAQKYTLVISINMFGWYFGISHNPFANTKFKKRTFYEKTIKDELNKSFNDNRKELLINILNVITNSSDSDSLVEIEYGAKSYHHIFEKMIDYVFGNVTDKRLYYARGTWRMINPTTHTFKTNYSLMPDTIRMTENAIYIIDSKCYRYGYTGDESDLPNIETIPKQIVYGEYAYKKCKDKITNVYNSYVIPYNKNDNKFNLNGKLEYIGYVNPDWYNEQIEKYKFISIYTFLIDMKTLIFAWNLKNKQDFSTILVGKIKMADSCNQTKELNEEHLDHPVSLQ